MAGTRRRHFILGGLAAAGAVLLPARPARADLAYPFTLGVASGDPWPDSVVLWTRLAPAPTSPDGYGGMPNSPVGVDWQVATDENLTQIVRSGTAVAQYASAHTVHVEVPGLQPGTVYFYRFRAAGHLSPVGRTRTAPTPDTVGGPLTLLTAACAHYESGLYTAYRRMAEEEPDVVLFLGDYVYEGAATTGGVQQHLPTAEAATLAGYRVRYGQYKSDPDLQAAHAVAPWVPVWDDHEVENNYAGLVRGNSSPVGDFVARRAAAYRAYYEHMPLRAAQAPANERLQLYRRLRWGQLATFHMLDTRQYRDDQACGDGLKVCADARTPTRTITGLEQETWLLNGLGQRLSTWDLIGQQVFFAQRRFAADGTMSMDAWDGYAASRDRVQRGWDARGVRGAVVLSGDVHRAYANDLMYDYDAQDRIIGTELVTTSIASGGDGDATDTGADAGRTSLNPHIRFYRKLRGYLRATVTPTELTADFRTVEKVTVAGYPVLTARSFVVEAGNPGLQDP